MEKEKSMIVIILDLSSLHTHKKTHKRTHIYTHMHGQTHTHIHKHLLQMHSVNKLILYLENF